jgi:hypothetical protein
VQGFYFAKPMQDHELAPFLLSGLTGILPQDRDKSIAA